MVRKMAVAVLVWLAGFSFAWSGPAQVIIIRHAEKPPEGHELSLKGRQRAAALVPYFLETPDVLEYKTPAAIYAQKSGEGHRSKRPVQTVKDLAGALRLEVIQFAHDDHAKMVREITANKDYEGKMVLICWEHKAIPDLAREFGVTNPPSFPGSAFDRTWIITFRPGKGPRLRDRPQQLMYGDSAK